MPHSNVIKTHASGRYLEIIRNLAPQLSEACDKPGKNVKCPCHGTKDGFRLFKDANETGGGNCYLNGAFTNIFDLLKWTNGWTFVQARDALAGYLGLTNSSIPKPSPPNYGFKVITKKKDYKKEKMRLQKIFGETIIDNGRIAEYFKYRGLTIPVPDTLTLHPSLYYHHEVPEGTPSTYFPAMIAQLSLNNKCVGLHITYLDPDGPGLAPCSQPRKLRTCYPNNQGSSVKLFPAIPGEPLVLGEGIETCLSIRQMTGFPVWSALNTSYLKTVDVPVDSNPIHIGVDIDKSGAGQRATDKICEKLHSEGKNVFIASPTEILPDGVKSFDWNDYLNIEREDPYDKRHCKDAS